MSPAALAVVDGRIVQLRARRARLQAELSMLELELDEAVQLQQAATGGGQP